MTQLINANTSSAQIQQEQQQGARLLSFLLSCSKFWIYFDNSHIFRVFIFVPVSYEEDVVTQKIHLTRC